MYSAAVNPRQLFTRCLELKQLDLAASYLIILQNMEPVSVSRQHATVLLDAALEQCVWKLAKDLVRFLRAIDPSEAECAAHPPYSTTPTSGWAGGVPGSAKGPGSAGQLMLSGSAPSPVAGALLPATKISLGSQTPPVNHFRRGLSLFILSMCFCVYVPGQSQSGRLHFSSGLDGSPSGQSDTVRIGNYRWHETITW